MRHVAVLTVLLMTSLSGCTAFNDFVDAIGRPDIAVSRTDVTEVNAEGYLTDPTFSVSVDEPGGGLVRIRAEGPTTLETEGYSNGDLVSLVLTDGTWTVTYWIDGHKFETFRDVKVDATPPSTQGLRSFGNAENGQYTIGGAYTLAAGDSIEIRDARGALLSTTIPYTITGLASGIHYFVIIVKDSAGNQAAVNAQVAAGDATLLPEGRYTFGIVARYTNTARIWDLSDMGAYATPGESASVGFLGSGYGITPDDEVVRAAVQSALSGEDTNMEIAWSLYRWLYDNLEYDEQRLDSTTLMLPRQVLADSEDPDGEQSPSQDAGEDGLADDGSGNGVKGGVCRDLAATYVSMLRAAGVPARLVSGYLAGNVNGFHAWVEVYVGARNGQDAWMPIDVSPIDGQWGSGDVPDGLQVALQSFGIALPNYLALRKIPEAGEQAGWSTALGTSYTFPSKSSAPRLTFEKAVDDIGAPQEGLLCFDPDTLERRLIKDSPGDDTSKCSNMYIIGRDRQATDSRFRDGNAFILGTQRIIDYGVQVTSASSGTEIEVELSYPFPDHVAPDSVEWAPYENADGFVFSQEPANAGTGKVDGTLRKQS